MWVFVVDGEVRQVRDELPSAQLTDRGDAEAITPVNAADHGWFPVVEVDQPSADHVHTVELVDGVWRQVWTLDTDVRAQRLKAEVARVRAQRLEQAVTTLRGWETSTTDANAVARLRILFGVLADLIETRDR